MTFSTALDQSFLTKRIGTWCGPFWVPASS